MERKQVNRRDFLKTSGTTAVASSAIAGLATARAAGSNERIRIGFIGPGGQGFRSHVKTLASLKNEGANIELVAATDVYSENRDRATGYIKKETGTSAKAYVDSAPPIEGVVVMPGNATPLDHPAPAPSQRVRGRLGLFVHAGIVAAPIPRHNGGPS